MTYLDHHQSRIIWHSIVGGGVAYRHESVPTHSWAEHTAERLRWAHGDAKAAQILAGKDPATNRDIAAWNRLGLRHRMTP